MATSPDSGFLEGNNFDSDQDNADHQAWDQAFDDASSDELLSLLVDKGMQGPFDVDEEGADIAEDL